MERIIAGKGADPQPKDGHVDIANELVEQLCRVNLTAYESRVLWFIFRKVNGWHKERDRISYSQFEKGTGLRRWHIARTLKKLKARNMIIVTPLGNSMEYSFQNDYTRWQPIVIRLDNKQKQNVTKTGQKTRQERDKGLYQVAGAKLCTTVCPTDSVRSHNIVSEESQLTHAEAKQTQKLPVEVTNKSLPRWAESLPNEVMKTLPNEVHTKEKKETNKRKGEDDYISLNASGDGEDDGVAKEITFKGGEVVSAATLWGLVLPRLRDDVPPSNYDSWLKGTEGLAFVDDRAFIIGVDAYHKEKEILRYKPLIEKAVLDVTGLPLKVEASY